MAGAPAGVGTAVLLEEANSIMQGGLVMYDRAWPLLEALWYARVMCVESER